MKVCHVTSVHALTDGRIFEKECCSLARLGYEVFLVGVGRSELKNGVYIVGVDSKQSNRIYRFLCLDKKVIDTALLLNCDVYHLHDPELLRFAMQIKKQGHKVIFDSHEDVPRQILSKYWIPKFLRKSVSYLYEKREKQICNRIDFVVSATESIRDAFRKYGIRSEAIFNYPVIGDEKRRASLGNSMLCFAGSLSESNGIPELIDIVNELKDVHLTLAGNFEPSVEQYFHEHKNDRIHYVGVLSRNDVDELYLRSSLGVVVDLPNGNNIDGLPIKLFEFMKFGLPILTSDFPIRRKIFEEFNCGRLVSPYDKKAYMDAIGAMLQNHEECKRAADNGVLATRTVFNWEKQEEKLGKIYEELKNE